MWQKIVSICWDACYCERSGLCHLAKKHLVLNLFLDLPNYDTYVHMFAKIPEENCYTSVEPLGLVGNSTRFEKSGQPGHGRQAHRRRRPPPCCGLVHVLFLWCVALLVCLLLVLACMCVVLHVVRAVACCSVAIIPTHS